MNGKRLQRAARALPATLRRGSTAACLGRRGDVFPEFFESVELAHPRQHHVHHHIGEIDEHPLAFARAFDAHGAEVVLLGELHHAIGDGFDVSIGIARCDDDDVGDIGEMPHVHDFDVDGLHVIECAVDDAQQGLRDRGLGRRLACLGATRTSFCGHFTPCVVSTVPSITPRLTNDLANRVGYQETRVTSRIDDLTQFCRGYFELGHGVHVDPARLRLVQFVHRAGAPIHHQVRPAGRAWAPSTRVDAPPPRARARKARASGASWATRERRPFQATDTGNAVEIPGAARSGCRRCRTRRRAALRDHPRQTPAGPPPRREPWRRAMQHRPACVPDAVDCRWGGNALRRVSATATIRRRFAGARSGSDQRFRRTGRWVPRRARQEYSSGAIPGERQRAASRELDDQQ